jgi:hypothetical protein
MRTWLQGLCRLWNECVPEVNLNAILCQIVVNLSLGQARILKKKYFSSGILKTTNHKINNTKSLINA